MTKKSIVSGFPPRAALLLIGVLSATGAPALGPSADEIAKFRELMAVKWLSCEFAPLAADSGELLEFIGFDFEKRRMRIRTAPPGETEFIESSVYDDESPLAKPMILVFDRDKTLVELVYPSRLNPATRNKRLQMIQKETLTNVQDVGWLSPGVVQFSIVIEVDGDQSLFGMILVPGKNAGGKFRALAHLSLFGFLLVMSAQCSEDIEPDLLVEIEKVQALLESRSAGASARRPD